jgi:HSP20 family molecular chaperone IbpA
MTLLLTRYPQCVGVHFENPLTYTFHHPRPHVRINTCRSNTAPGNQVRINESENRVQLSLDLPGVKASDLRVNVDNQVLTISGNRTFARGNQTSSVGFSRQFALDVTVDTSNLTANLADGVLTVSAPKVAKPGPINVTVTEGASSIDQDEVVTVVQPDVAGLDCDLHVAALDPADADDDLVMVETAREDESVEHDETTTKA